MSILSSAPKSFIASPITSMTFANERECARWTTSVFPSSTLKRKLDRSRPFGSSNSRRNKPPRSSRSCRAATCTAHFASSLKLAAQNAAEKYVDLVRRVREARPEISITTDIIVGFPGETEEDFAHTCALVKEVQFDNAFVFRYSPRRNTPAAEMPDQIDESVKERRNQDLLRIVNESARRCGERLVGCEVEVLCQGPSKTNLARLMGRTRTNKIVVFEGDEELSGG